MTESEIYQPAEDSYLMLKALKSEISKLLQANSELKFLEIGFGLGIALETAFSLGIKKENILGTDINNNAVRHCRKLGFNCILSDLFAKKPSQKFDLIIFNPPYLRLMKKSQRIQEFQQQQEKTGTR